MQLTRFDHWLREKFVYETHIHTLRPTEKVPRKVRFVELPEAPGRRYKYLYIARSSKAADQLLLQLKEASQMYTTQIVDKQAWYVPFIAPKTKSVTWWLFSAVVFAISGFFVLTYLRSLVENPSFRKNFSEAIEIMKG